MKALVMLLVAGCALWAQTPNTKIVDGVGTERIASSAGKRFTIYISAVPNSSTVVTDSTTTLNVGVEVQLIYCTNTTGSAITFSFSDNVGSPNSYATTVSIAANSVVGVYASPIGLALRSGMKWTASASSGLNCQIQGVFSGPGGVD